MSFLLLQNELPQPIGLKHYTSSVGQPSGHSLSGSSAQGPTSCNEGVSQGWCSHLEGGSSSKSFRIQFLVMIGLGRCPKAVHMRVICFLKVSRRVSFLLQAFFFQRRPVLSLKDLT